MTKVLRFAVLCAMIFGAGALKAQEKYVREGDKLYGQRMYIEAADSYQRSLAKLKPAREQYVDLQLARSYKSLFDYKKSAEWFGKLKDITEPEVHRDYGYVLLSLGKYDDALSQFREYCSKAGKSDQLAKYEKLCTWPVSQASKKLSKYNVYESNLPIGNRAYGMSYYSNGVVFSAPQQQTYATQTTYYDLAYAPISDTVSFGAMQPLAGSVNHTFYDAAPSATADGKMLYFTSNVSEETKYDPKKVKKTKVVSSAGRNVLQIYYSSNNVNEWSKSEKVAFDSVEYNYAFPFITPDGNTLYFASDMPGGYGKLDIYRIKRTGENQWGTPENLGPEVNTEEDDIYPYIAGDKFYFSSRGREGFGGLDIYSALINNNTISGTRNMGMPVNSTADDFAFILKDDAQTGYLSSNRDNFSSDAVFALTRRADMDTLRGVVRGDGDDAGKPLAGVTVNLYRLDGNNPVLVRSMTTAGDGKWEFIVDPNSDYKVEFVTDGYDKQDVQMTASLNSDGEKVFKKDVGIALRKTQLSGEELARQAGDGSNADLIFVVQIGAYHWPNNFNYSSVTSLGKVEKKKLEDGITRFTIGSFKTLNEGNAFREKILQKGILDAFVLAIYKGKRMYMQDLLREGLLTKN